MRIAVCLLTCNRHYETAVSAKTFVEWNRDLGQFANYDLLHCDGGSHWPNNVEIAKRYGFKTLIAPPPDKRIGQMETLLVFLAEARRRNCEWVMWLENDWESVAPLPQIDFIAESGVETIRLFGRRKFREGHRAAAGLHRIGTNIPIEWKPSRFPGWEEGLAHWGAGGTLVRRDVLERCMDAKRLKDVITANNQLRSLRPVENIMFSIGFKTTEGFMG